MAKGFKSGGRVKGTPNKVTTEIKEAYSKLLQNNLTTLQDDLNALEPKDRIKAIIDITKFLLPTLRASDVSVKELPIPEHLDYLLNASDKEITKVVEDDIQRMARRA